MVAPDAVWALLQIATIPLFVLANAFFVAAEFSLVTVRPTRVQEMVQKGVVRARLLQLAIADPDRVIAATQVGITVASLGLGWVGEPVLARFLDWSFAKAFGASPGPAAAHGIALGVAFFLISFLHVLVGEQIPKSIAIQRPAQTGLFIAAPYILTERLFRPFVWVLNAVSDAVVRLLGLRPLPPHQQVHSAEEIKMLVAASLKGGALEPDQGAMMSKAIELASRKVGDIMVPREKIVAVDIHTPQDRLLEIVAEQGYTRMPVYDGALDRVVGIVHTKDLFTIIASKGLIILEDLVRDPYIVAPELEVDEILRGFRRLRVHLAIVRDGQQRVVGIVTLEDVLEQLVGHIADEHDITEIRVRTDSKGNDPLPNGP